MKFLLSLGIVLGLGASLQAQALTQVANCVTGDAVDGVTVYTDGENFTLEIQSLDDQQAPDVYKTNQGDVAQESYDVNAVLKSLGEGKSKTLVLTKADSISFGGAVTNAALLNLKISAAANPERNSLLGYRGQVLSLACKKPRD